MNIIVPFVYVGILLIGVYATLRLSLRYGSDFKIRDLKPIDKFWFVVAWLVIAVWVFGIVFAICTSPISQ